MVLEVGQANLHHAKAASAVVCRRFDSEGLDLALLQEPWYHGGFVRGLNPKLGKTLYSKSASRPRACIVLKYGIGCTLIPELCSGDFVTALLNIITEGGPRKLVVCSAYFPGDEDCLPSLLGDIVAHCRRERLQLILGCDANAHNTAWGSTDDNARGKLLLEFISGEGLHVSNIGSVPTFVTATRREVLDLTLATRCMSNTVINWHVSNEPSCSDHRHIRFDICVPPLVIKRLRSPRETHWAGFTQALTESLTSFKVDVRRTESIEQAVVHINEAILEAYQDNCPEKIRPQRSKTVWWNSHLEKRRKEVRRLFNKAKHNQDWDSYRQALTQYNKKIRKAKRSAWRSFCEDIKETPECARIHRVLAKEE
ncbi:uncharacterized protein [Rhodnius prolixus]|uniref:uncharacterized protein n=1 Tax=Rhodnius prolixus TaxID=13249 RepID=UPI003D18DCC7